MEESKKVSVDQFVKNNTEDRYTSKTDIEHEKICNSLEFYFFKEKQDNKNNK